MKTSPPSKASVQAPPSCLLYNTDDDFVKVIKDANQQDFHLSATHEDLRDIDCFIQDLECLLWPLNSFLHANPETAYRERKAHDVLTSFMKSRTGWQVTCSAYGMETAWVAEFDSGLPGPVVSFNAEMGMFLVFGDPKLCIASATVSLRLADSVTLIKYRD